MKISQLIEKLSEQLVQNGDGEVWLIPFSIIKMTKDFGIFPFDDYLVNEEGNMVTPFSEFTEASKSDVFIDEFY